MDLAADITPDDLKVFLQESEEHLQLLDEAIVRLERVDADEREVLLQEIFRASHTLKGSSAMLGYGLMAELAHSMETVLDKLRNGALAVTTQVVDALLHSLDGLKELNEELVSPQGSEIDITGAIADLEQVVKSEATGTLNGPGASSQAFLVPDESAIQRIKEATGEGANAYLLKATFSESTIWAAVRCFQVIDVLSQMGEVVASLPTRDDIENERVGLDIQVLLTSPAKGTNLQQLVEKVEEVAQVDISEFSAKGADVTLSQGPSAEDATSRRAVQTSQTVRIDVERLDHLMNTIGELVIDRTRMIQVTKALEDKYKEDSMVQALSQTSAHIVKVVSDLEDVILRIRMLPIGTVFSGFSRLVRDMAQKADKDLELVVDGQDTEIDRTIIERIRDPLVHLLRNAIDHGIETREERQTAGKRSPATIWLSAHHEQGHIIISVQDDGRGIDPDRIRDAAVNKGLVTAENAQKLSDNDALGLIFTPGFSTVQKATEVSGRGVGMDIVKTNIEAINGLVNIDSKVGEGTKFTLQLPLSLATLRALLVSLGNTIYAIPLIYVVEAVRLQQSSVIRVGAGEMIRLRDKVMPLMRVSNVINVMGGNGTDSNSNYVVVTRFGDRVIGLTVDALMDSQEIMVKSLGGYIGAVKGIAGVSILGDGQVVLILDVPSLITSAMSKNS